MYLRQEGGARDFGYALEDGGRIPRGETRRPDQSPTRVDTRMDDSLEPREQDHVLIIEDDER
ncbi:hypothetical protein, partial [Staphylococcus aureus]|uniref:hypothetical protein n=1 Tax=Staphylococcus aureus TaxID=1280 RepID=UPI00301E0AD1